MKLQFATVSCKFLTLQVILWVLKILILPLNFPPNGNFFIVLFAFFDKKFWTTTFTASFPAAQNLGNGLLLPSFPSAVTTPLIISCPVVSVSLTLESKMGTSFPPLLGLSLFLFCAPFFSDFPFICPLSFFSYFPSLLCPSFSTCSVDCLVKNRGKEM